MSYSEVHLLIFFFSSRRRHTRSDRDWSSDVCSSDLRAEILPGLDPAKACEVVIRLELQHAKPCAHRVAHLAQLDKTEPQRVVDKGVLDAVAEGLFIGQARPHPVLELHALEPALTRRRPLLELRSCFGRYGQRALERKEFPGAFEEAFARRRAVEDCGGLDEFAQRLIQVGRARFGGVEQPEAGAEVFAALD